MIVCGCGAENSADAQFCADCGEFLEWSGAPAERPVAERPVAEARTGDEGQRSAPVAVQPGPGPTRRPQPAPAPTGTPVVGPGEVGCPRCRRGNDPARHFCRFCGSELRLPDPPAPPPWWRRLLTRLTRRRVYAAGQRPPRHRRRWLRRLVLSALTVAVLAAVVVASPRLFDPVANAVRDAINRDQIHPTTFRASSAAAQAPARHVGDLDPDRYWAPSGAARRPWVEVTFPEPFHLRVVLVTPGVSRDQPAFVAHGRPRRVALTVTQADGTSTVSETELPDEPGAVPIRPGVPRVVKVRLTVLSTYPAPERPAVAVAEVEFRGKRE